MGGELGEHRPTMGAPGVSGLGQHGQIAPRGHGGDPEALFDGRDADRSLVAQKLQDHPPPLGGHHWLLLITNVGHGHRFAHESRRACPSTRSAREGRGHAAVDVEDVAGALGRAGIRGECRTASAMSAMSAGRTLTPREVRPGPAPAERARPRARPGSSRYRAPTGCAATRPWPSRRYPASPGGEESFYDDLLSDLAQVPHHLAKGCSTGSPSGSRRGLGAWSGHAQRQPHAVVVHGQGTAVGRALPEPAGGAQHFDPFSTGDCDI